MLCSALNAAPGMGTTPKVNAAPGMGRGQHPRSMQPQVWERQHSELAGAVAALESARE